MVVPLFHRRFGDADLPPLVILHGLLGSSRNWLTVARELAGRFTVYTPDLRNHGESPRDDETGYRALVGDIAAWLDANSLPTVHLLGHSMGGKAAMRFALDFPERLRSLTIVDIAPRDYDHHHRIEFAAMRALDLAAISDRREADAALAATVPDWAMRQFLLTNLERGDDGRFFWRVNHLALEAGLPEISANPLAPDEVYAAPVRFFIGGKSSYVRPRDRVGITRCFPAAELVELPASGHNPHIEDRAAFVEKLAAGLAD